LFYDKYLSSQNRNEHVDVSHSLDGTISLQVIIAFYLTSYVSFIKRSMLSCTSNCSFNFLTSLMVYFCIVLVVWGPTWFLKVDKTSQSWPKVYRPRNWAYVCLINSWYFI